MAVAEHLRLGPILSGRHLQLLFSEVRVDCQPSPISLIYWHLQCYDPYYLVVALRVLQVTLFIHFKVPMVTSDVASPPFFISLIPNLAFVEQLGLY